MLATMSGLTFRFSGIARENGRMGCSRRARSLNLRALPSRSIPELVDQSKRVRLDNLMEQAKIAVTFAVENGPVTFPCACIAGDVVILHLLNELGYLKTEEVKVVMIDTLHLFPETIEFFQEKQEAYGFKGDTYKPDGCVNKADFEEKYGYDIWKQNIELYDKVAKVEPFQRALQETKCRTLLTGRRRDHGFERAFIEIYEEGKSDIFCNVQPLAYWTFEDCFDFIELYSIPAHPLHEKGYPSIGDAKDTVPVSRDKWFEYAGERSGRFQGLTDTDGEKKTECGMHVSDDGSEPAFDRDLWDERSKVEKLTERASLEDLLAHKPERDEHGKFMIVYAPWCKYCMAAENAFESFAEQAPGIAVAYRGDNDRDFVSKIGVQSFPTFLYVPGGKRDPVKFEGSEEDRTPEMFLQFYNSMEWFHKGSPDVFR